MAQVPATLAGACSTVLVVAEVVVAEVAVVALVEVALVELAAEVAAVAGPQAIASAAELINRHCRAKVRMCLAGFGSKGAKPTWALRRIEVLATRESVISLRLSLNKLIS